MRKKYFPNTEITPNKFQRKYHKKTANDKIFLFTFYSKMLFTLSYSGFMILPKTRFSMEHVAIMYSALVSKVDTSCLISPHELPMDETARNGDGLVALLLLV